MSPAGSSAPLFLLSPPRADWGLRGRANAYAAQAASPTPQDALRDWIAVADAIAAAGGEIAVLRPSARAQDTTLTGLPYTAEAGQMGFVDGVPTFLLPRVTPPHRRGEAAVVAAALRGWGVPVVELPGAALWEGQGDVIRVDDARAICTSGEGPWARTDADAFDAVAPLLPLRTMHVRFHADPWFHGNTFLGAFRAVDGSGRVVVVVCADALHDGELARLRAFVRPHDVVVIDRATSLGYATNALQVGGHVLAPVGLPSTMHALWWSLGLHIDELSLPALFSRGGGAAVCLSNRLDGIDASALPVDVLWRSCRNEIVGWLAGYPDFAVDDAQRRGTA